MTCSKEMGPNRTALFTLPTAQQTGESDHRAQWTLEPHKVGAPAPPWKPVKVGGLDPD